PGGFIAPARAPPGGIIAPAPAGAPGDGFAAGAPFDGFATGAPPDGFAAPTTARADHQARGREFEINPLPPHVDFPAPAPPGGFAAHGPPGGFGTSGPGSGFATLASAVPTALADVIPAAYVATRPSLSPIRREKHRRREMSVVNPSGNLNFGASGMITLVDAAPPPSSSPVPSAPTSPVSPVLGTQTGSSSLILSTPMTVGPSPLAQAPTSSIYSCQTVALYRPNDWFEELDLHSRHVDLHIGANVPFRYVGFSCLIVIELLTFNRILAI
ncbi:hypothetical protein EST38_g14209, partial [Candolleomyces aberdarensis]